jgi:hypothetical protein
MKKKAPILGTLKVLWDVFGRKAIGSRATVDRNRKLPIDPFPKPGKRNPKVQSSANLFSLPLIEAWLRRRGVYLPEFDYS